MNNEICYDTLNRMIAQLKPKHQRDEFEQLFQQMSDAQKLEIFLFIYDTWQSQTDYLKKMVINALNEPKTFDIVDGEIE